MVKHNANTESELVSWHESYSVGVKIIDDQHKELINLVNDLFNHVVGNEEAEREYFQKVIHEAVNYVKVHFATEERIMLATKFKGYDAHKKEHDSFVMNVIKNAKDYEAGKRLTLTSFTKFLKDWVLTHIAVMDKLYFDYFKKIASRKQDGKLSITSADVK
ncbi:MAG: bacteriohemerythrin [Treponema sp.]|jgi:hemerythrin|nr:bacteriohemerythrin [Treponema sp.]